jgi:hypothetical protein
MKTQNNKLDFKKNSIVELNDDSMNTVKGGSLTITVSITISITVSIVTRTIDEVLN